MLESNRKSKNVNLVQQCIRKGSSQVKFTFLPEEVRETGEKNRMGNMTILSDFVFSSDLCLRETKIYNLFQRNCTGLDIYKNTSEY